MQRQAFGLRNRPPAEPPLHPPAAPATPIAHIAPPAPEIAAPAPDATPSVEDEVLEWKRTRGSRFLMPWRQVYLMASLCFGIASLVLPDLVNNNVDWLLWGLSGMSAYAWYTGRKAKRVKGSAAP